MAESVRNPAVAGMFYPDDPGELRAQIREFLAGVEPQGPPPKAVIAPHAGYIYSGPVAASVYARLLGPSHRVGFQGIAVSEMDCFETPLGRTPVDKEAVKKILHLPAVGFLEEAHAQEHSLEVHLPFLQEVLGEFSLVPLSVGDVTPEEVGSVIEALWGGPETLIVISSDLSHYHDYQTACRIDAATTLAIEQLRYEDIGYDQACGRNPIRGLLWAARRRGLREETLDLRNSGDTAGPRHRVVGYGAYAFSE